jgi:hypothetical protein
VDSAEPRDVGELLEDVRHEASGSEAGL